MMTKFVVAVIAMDDDDADPCASCWSRQHRVISDPSTVAMIVSPNPDVDVDVVGGGDGNSFDCPHRNSSRVAKVGQDPKLGEEWYLPQRVLLRRCCYSEISKLRHSLAIEVVF